MMVERLGYSIRQVAASAESERSPISVEGLLSAQSDYRLQRCFATQALSASAIAPLWLFNGQLVEVAFAAVD